VGSSSTPLEVVESFWSALAGRDVPRARTHLSQSAVLEAAGIRARGGAAFGLSLAAMMLGAQMPLRVVSAVGSRLIVERSGYLYRAWGGPYVILALINVGEDRIESWQEYFDLELVARPRAKT
jgi:limonene-1,2-epoxide hydrolase